MAKHFFCNMKLSEKIALPHIMKTKLHSPPQTKTYADSVRTPATNRNIPAQPQFVRKSNYQRKPHVYRSSASENQFSPGNTAVPSGANNVPLGNYRYNVQIKNRFVFPASGN